MIQTKTALTALLGAVPLTVAGAIITANPAQAGVFSNKLWVDGSGSLLIDTENICAANNFIDFQDGTNANPCLSGANQFGTLGDGEVTGATGFFNALGMLGDQGTLFNKPLQIMDIALPGVPLSFPLDGSTFNVTDPGGGAISIINFIRFDTDMNGIIGDEGDITFSVTGLNTSATDTGNGFAVTLDFDGYFEEVISASNIGLSTENIVTGGDRLFASTAIISGGISSDPNTLSLVGTLAGPGCNLVTFGPPDGNGSDGTPIDNLNPASPCFAAFGAAPLKDFTSADGVFAATKNQVVPEPSSLVGLAVVALAAGLGLKKGKSSH